MDVSEALLQRVHEANDPKLFRMFRVVLPDAFDRNDKVSQTHGLRLQYTQSRK